MHIGDGTCRIRGNHPGGGRHKTSRDIVIHHHHGAIGHGQEQTIRRFVVGQIPGIA